MPEPLSHSAAGATAALIPAAVTTSFLGLEPVALGWAFIGGTIYLIWLGRMDHWAKACGTIFISTFIGTCFAQNTAEPVLLIVQHNWPYLLPWAINAKFQAMSIIALLVGIFCQAAMPGLMKRAEGYGKGKKNA